MKNLLSLILLVCLTVSIVLAQDKPIDILNQDVELTRVQRKMKARQYIEAFKDGVLIVRLKTQDKALKKLKGILASPDASEAQKQRIRDKEIPKIKAERDELENILRKAFQQKYTFSKVYFMPDVCTTEVIEGNELTCLTDTKGQSVSIDLKDRLFVVVDYRQLSNDRNANITGLIANDNNFKLLVEPFPYFQRNGGFFTQLSNKKLTLKNAVRMVEKWQEKLNRYLLEVQESKE